MCVCIHVRTAMNEGRQQEARMAITQDTLGRIKKCEKIIIILFYKFYKF